MTGELRRNFATLEASLKQLPRQLPVKPKAILTISGHWEERPLYRKEASGIGREERLVVDLSPSKTHARSIQFLPWNLSSRDSLITLEHAKNNRGFGEG